MSMYEVAVADGHQHERGAVLLAVLGNPEVARFRDVWCEKGEDGPVIHLYTRQGGPNRACCAASNEALQAHPLYLRDADDSFDHTYASFWFSAPPMREMQEALATVAVDPVDTDARWQEAIARVQRGDLRPSEVAMMDQVAAGLGDTSPGGGKVIRI
jgi:hypothetical protein